MDYSALIKKSFSFAWNNRILWLFGFLSGGTSTVGYIDSSGFNFTLPSSTPRLPELKETSKVLGVSDNTLGAIPMETWLIIILIIGLVVLVVILISIFITNWASAALVYSILHRNIQKPSFSIGAKAGLKFWWRFYLLALVVGMFILAVLAVLALPVIFLFLTKWKALAVVILILAIVVFVIFLFIVSVIATLLITISQRMIIHKGTKVLDSLRLSSHLIKKNLGESIITYFLAIGLNIAAGSVFFLAFIPIGIVLFLLFLAGMAFGGVWGALVILGVIAIPLLLILATAGGFWSTFQATYWTLFYEHLASKEGW